MKVKVWIAILVCVGLFFAGLSMRIDSVDARECRQIAAILFVWGFLAAPVMCFMEFLMRCLSKRIARVVHSQSVAVGPIRSVPFGFWIAMGAAYLSFALGGFVGAICKGSASFWAGLVAAGFGFGLLSGFGVCWSWARKSAKREETAVPHKR